MANSLTYGMQACTYDQKIHKHLRTTVQTNIDYSW